MEENMNNEMEPTESFSGWFSRRGFESPQIWVLGF